MATIKPKFQESGLYLLFCDRAIEDTSIRWGLKKDEVILYCWCHYINKYVLKGAYYDLDKTAEVIDKLVLTNFKTKALTSTRLKRLFGKLRGMGKVNMGGKKYLLDKTNGTVVSLMSYLTRASTDFWLMADDLKNEVKAHKMRKPKKKRGKRPSRRYPKQCNKCGKSKYTYGKRCQCGGEYVKINKTKFRQLNPEMDMMPWGKPRKGSSGSKSYYKRKWYFKNPYKITPVEHDEKGQIFK